MNMDIKPRLTVDIKPPLNMDIKPRVFERLSNLLGIELWVQEDYRLPFPFAGNKWVKLAGHYGEGTTGVTYITNGGVNSNHCRTLAIWAAFHGHPCHLVLHNDKDEDASLPLDFLQRLGATYTVVKSVEIADTIERIRNGLQGDGHLPVIVPGGGHASGSVIAYADYAAPVIASDSFDFIFHASGTGGTQAGICIANHEVDSAAQVVGISVARGTVRGTEVVQETIREASGLELSVDFRDEHVDGGYGPGGEKTYEAMKIAGSGGLVLDSTYTGKAFAGLLQSIRTGEIQPGAKVLFWHTGGSVLSMTA